MFNNKVVSYCGLKPTLGDIGIEIELEAYDYVDFATSVDPLWRKEVDNSLKINGVEFVIKKPVPYKSVTKVLSDFRENLKKCGIRIRPSIRAGVHIHINMQEQTVNEVIRFMAIYYAMETALIRFCGEGREGNLFCLRARDADYAVFKLEEAIIKSDFLTMKDQNLRYAACNVQSLFQYGSVEFRAFGTNPELLGIEEWIEMLWAIKEYAAKTKDVWADLAFISADGGYAWMKGVLGDKLSALLYHEDLEKDMINDVRNIQHLCHLMKKAKI